MDKSKKAKLAELRKKKSDKNKQVEIQRHSELLDALNGLHDLFDQKSKIDSRASDLLLEKLSELDGFKEEVTAVKHAIESLPKIEDVKINNIADLVALQKDVDVSEVTHAIKALTKEVKNQVADSVTIENKKPQDYIPTRRVIEKQGQLVFDDKPVEVTVVGGGGSTIAGVQKELTRNNDSIAIVNPDGTPISLEGVTMTERYASVGEYDYIGEAPVGTLTSQSLWTITRYSATEGKVALNTAWDDYLTGVYL